jgi:hypothetical protein
MSTGLNFWFEVQPRTSKIVEVQNRSILHGKVLDRKSRFSKPSPEKDASADLKPM